MITVLEVMQASPVIPVLAFENSTEAVGVCRTLHSAGIKVLEITLRHPSALEAIAAVKQALPDDVIIGAGTVTTPDLAEKAKAAGAVFGVSPGLTADLAASVHSLNWPFLPGIASLSEAMAAREMGFTELKFFPANISGGPDFLKAVGSVLPDLTFCPTGGVSVETAAKYCALKNVITVGGSWITPREADGSFDLEKIDRLAHAALL